MKGIVFREFLDLVEAQFSPAIADAIISASELSTDGAYTAVGTYPHQEMVQLVSHLASHTGKSVPDLLRHFGHHMFSRLATLHPRYMENHHGVFPLLRALDNHIHVEVRKLYSHTELPTFSHEDSNDGALKLRYTSTRRMADFAHGLIEGCIDYFKEPIGIERIDFPEDERGAHTQFTLTRMVDGAGG